MKNPLLSVVLPVYNAEKYIHECIESILSQTFTDFELLIFNDGSTDNSVREISKFTDPRLKLYNGEVNNGYVKHLNDGILKAKGEFIVRMDADDVCYKNRFEQLLKFMTENPNVGVCGSYVKVFGNVKEYTWKLICDNNAIKALLPFRIPFIHPSVMIRKKVLIDNNIFYNNSYLPAEDYEVWCHLSPYTDFANIPVVLLKYRQHSSQISKEKRKIQQINSDRARSTYFDKLFLNKVDLDLYQDIVNERIECSIDFFKRSTALFKRMEEVNLKIALFEPASFHNELSFQLFKIATHLSSHKVKTLKALKKSEFSESTLIDFKLYLRFFIKNILIIGK